MSGSRSGSRRATASVSPTPSPTARTAPPSTWPPKARPAVRRMPATSTAWMALAATTCGTASPSTSWPSCRSPRNSSGRGQVRCSPTGRCPGSTPPAPAGPSPSTQGNNNVGPYHTGLPNQTGSGEGPEDRRPVVRPDAVPGRALGHLRQRQAGTRCAGRTGRASTCRCRSDFRRIARASPLRWDVFNVLNTVNLGLPNADISSATVGTISSLGGDAAPDAVLAAGDVLARSVPLRETPRRPPPGDASQTRP